MAGGRWPGAAGAARDGTRAAAHATTLHGQWGHAPLDAPRDVTHELFATRLTGDGTGGCVTKMYAP